MADMDALESRFSLAFEDDSILNVEQLPELVRLLEKAGMREA